MELSTVDGISDTIKRMHTVAGEYADGMEQGLIRAGLFLLARAQEFVPVDTGFLKRSGYVAKTGKGFSTLVSVGFTAPYAIWVHERLDLHHAPPTMAKFLEHPATLFRDQMAQIIREEASRRRKSSVVLLGEAPHNLPGGSMPPLGLGGAVVRARGASSARRGAQRGKGRSA